MQGTRVRGGEGGGTEEKAQSARLKKKEGMYVSVGNLNVAV